LWLLFAEIVSDCHGGNRGLSVANADLIQSVDNVPCRIKILHGGTLMPINLDASIFGRSCAEFARQAGVNG
jgi:hypothetical protein